MTPRPDIELLTDELVEAQAAFKTHGIERTRAALRGGAALARLKTLLPHGGFTVHVETHGYTARTAQRWMHLNELALRLELTAEDIQERGGIGKALKTLGQAAQDALSPEGEDADSGESGNDAEPEPAAPVVALQGNNLRTFDWDAIVDEDNILHVADFTVTGSERVLRGTIKIHTPLPLDTDAAQTVVCIDFFPNEGVQALADLLPAGRAMAYIEAVHSTAAFQAVICGEAEETWGSGVRRYFSPWAMDGDLCVGDEVQFWVAPLLADEQGDGPEPAAPAVVLEGNDTIDREWLESLGLYYSDGEDLGCYDISDELGERLTPGNMSIDFFQEWLRFISVCSTKEEADALAEACGTGNVIEMVAGDDGDSQCIEVVNHDAEIWNRLVESTDTYRVYILFNTWRVNGKFRVGEQCLLYHHRPEPDGEAAEPETGEEHAPAAPSVIIEERRRLGMRGPWRDLGGFTLQGGKVHDGVMPEPGHPRVLISPPNQYAKRPQRIHVEFHPDDLTDGGQDGGLGKGAIVVLAHEPVLIPDGNYLYGVSYGLTASEYTGLQILNLGDWGAHGVIEAGREARLLIADRANRPFQPKFDPAHPPFPPPKPEIATVRRCLDCGSSARRGGDRCRPCEGQANPIYEQSRLEVQQLREGQKGLLRQINHLAGQVKDLRKRLAEAESKPDIMSRLEGIE